MLKGRRVRMKGLLKGAAEDPWGEICWAVWGRVGVAEDKVPNEERQMLEDKGLLKTHG